MDITKQVVVMMPFSGNKGAPGRRCLLDFLRRKYLVEEKMQVTAPLVHGRTVVAPLLATFSRRRAQISRANRRNT